MIKIRIENHEVLYPDQDVVTVSAADLEELKRLALLNPRQRIRLCAHSAPNHPLHEMFIVHTQDCYIPPHKHLGKAESMAIIEGEVDIVLFDEDGSLQQTIQMGAPKTGKIFYQRLPESVYHTLIIRTPFLVFHETTEGPFLRENTVFAEWAPALQGAESKTFIERIDAQLNL